MKNGWLSPLPSIQNWLFRVPGSTRQAPRIVKKGVTWGHYKWLKIQVIGYFTFPKNHGISKLVVWDPRTLLYRAKPLHSRVQWFLGLLVTGDFGAHFVLHINESWVPLAILAFLPRRRMQHKRNEKWNGWGKLKKLTRNKCRWRWP